MSTPNSLVTRPFGDWPDWRCVAVEAATGSLCFARATWQRKPTARAATAWTYCDRHKPDDAEPIAPDAPFYVTRLELRVAVVGAPGDRAAAAEEAIRRITYAVESVGGVVAAMRVPGHKASPAAAEGPPLRLQLAGPGEPADSVRARVVEAPSEPRAWRWRKGRAAS